VRAITGDWGGMLEVRIGNLDGGGEGGLMSASIKLLCSGMGGGDDVTTLAGGDASGIWDVGGNGG
jgi:hypothetical protein